MPEHRNSNDLQAFVNAYYERHYRDIHASQSLAAANAKLHSALERGFAVGHYPKTLELGSGNFEHMPFVRHTFDEYLCVDLRQPSPQVMDVLTSFPGSRFEAGNAQELHLESGTCDRVLATCLIMHLPDPVAALREWQRVCAPDGRVDFVVSCDPGLALRAFRKLVSERNVRKFGLDPMDHRLVNAFDHVSSFHRILELARFATEPGRELHVRYYPNTLLPFFNLNAFAVMTYMPHSLGTRAPVRHGIR